MQKEKKKKKQPIRKGKESFIWPLGRRNYMLFGIGLITLVAGYLFLMQGPWDSFWSRTLAPVILVIGYLVLIPAAILYRQKST